MRKFIFATTFLVTSAIVFTSCEKEDNYTCKCTLDGTPLVSEVFTNVTKWDAKSKCNEYAAQLANSSNGRAIFDIE